MYKEMSTLAICILIAIALLVGFAVGVDTGLRRVNDFFDDSAYLEEFRKNNVPLIQSPEFLTVAYALQREAQTLKFRYTIVSVLVALVIAILGFYVIKAQIKDEIMFQLEVIRGGGFSPYIA